MRNKAVFPTVLDFTWSDDGQLGEHCILYITLCKNSAFLLKQFSPTAEDIEQYLTWFLCQLFYAESHVSYQQL